MNSAAEAELFESASEIFLQALDLPSLEQQLDYLDEACLGNPQLRSEVDALLRAHAASADFLETSLFEHSSGSPPIGIGYMLGRYYLAEVIGEGGMGIVYRAEQLLPVERDVALKLIRPGRDSSEVVERFRHERQALAMMDHENVARILDGGTTDDGRPYLVMELVDGLRLTEHCRQRRLTRNQRLRLFIQACQGIEHAHQKGVIHRDVKPSNLLVATRHDGPVVKVIDFGIAKAVGFKITEQTLTAPGRNLLGTLHYMSPEQLAGRQAEVDARSDIFGLGVVLYELLTGTTPIPPSRVADLPLDEVLRLLRESEPERPSVRLRQVRSGLSQQVESATRDVGTIPRDLERVVLKTLEREPDRRYQTTREFVADLERYLQCRPVAAASPSVIYRCRKFISRNPVVAASLAFVTLALCVTSFVSTWAAFSIAQARDQVSRHATQFISGILAANSQNSFRQLDALRQYPKMRESLQPSDRAENDILVRSAALTILARLGHREVERIPLPVDAGKEAPLAMSSRLSHMVLQRPDGRLELRDRNGNALAKSVPLEPASLLRFCDEDRYLTAAVPPRPAKADKPANPGQLAVFRVQLADTPHIESLFNVTTSSPWAHDCLENRFVYAATDDGERRVHVIDMLENQAVRTVSWPIEQTPSRLYLRPPDGQQLLVLGTRDGQRQALLHDCRGGAPSSLPEGLRDPILACWTSDGRYLATADSRHTVQLWDMRQGTLIRQWQASGSRLVGLTFDPTDRLLATSGWENVLRVWDPWNVGLQTSQCVVALPRVGHAMGWFHRDGGQLEFTDRAQLVRVRLAQSSIFRFHPADRHDTGSHCISISRNNQALAIAGEGWAAVHDPMMPSRSQYLPAVAKKGAALDDSGSRLVTHSGDHLYFWNIAKNENEFQVRRLGETSLKGGEPRTSQCRVSPIANGRFAAVLNARSVGIFRIDGDCIHGPDQEFSYNVDINDLDLSADGRWLAIGGRQSAPVTLQEVFAPKRMQHVEGLGNGQKRVRFGSSNHRVLVGSPREYRILQLEHGQWITQQSFVCDMAFPTAAFNHDESLLASVNRDREVEIRRGPDFQLVYRLREPVPRWASCLAFDARGEKLYVAGHGGLRVWDLRAAASQLVQLGLEEP